MKTPPQLQVIWDEDVNDYLEEDAKMDFVLKETMTQLTLLSEANNKASEKVQLRGIIANSEDKETTDEAFAFRTHETAG